MIGRSISQYQILEKLGEGGMGVVYKAEDTRLKRTVALKFLPPELTRDPQAKKRFLQEAQAAAALDHPNICTIHEINEAEGQTYIAMAYVEGNSLKEKLEAGPLAVSEALDIAVQVAEGLRQAHVRGIIHRDIKPGNIMLTEDGRAKIMDFGLAKLTSGHDVTKTLTVMGTAAYMSPEQVRGEAVDHRTDIWSFGATLYEIMTGQTPFAIKKDDAAHESALPDMPALLHSILYESLEPPSLLRQDIPRQVEEIILKALEKDKNRRYQKMDEVLRDLKAARSPQIVFPKPEKSIVILPFENISPDPEQEYFCDGMTEEIIADLSKIHSLRVISRTSAMMLKGTKKDIQTISRELNVQYVLEGSVRKAGNNLRITAQLIDAPNDAHLWAEKYSGTLDDIFDIQEKVSRSIVKELELRLTKEENRKIAEKPVPGFYAYDCYMRAKHEIWKLTEEGLDKALKYLQQGLDIAGGNAVLFAGMAYVYFNYVNMGIKIDEMYRRKAEEYADKALDLDPESALAHMVLGPLNAWKGDLKSCFESIKLALAADPNNADVILWAAGFYGCIGKPDAAIALIERFEQLEPLSSLGKAFRGGCHLFAGRFALALELAQSALAEFPDDVMMLVNYGLALACLNRLEDAVSVLSAVVTEEPNSNLAQLYYLVASASRAQKNEILASLQARGLEDWAKIDFQYSFHVSEIYAQLGEIENALEWLEHAVSIGFINYPFLNEYDPLLANIRSEPRFQKLMERVKYEWEHFEV